MLDLIGYSDNIKVNIVQNIGGKWRMVGIALLDDKTGDRVAGIDREFRSNEQSINQHILTLWINGQGMSDRTWRGLIGVLQRKHCCAALAGDIWEALTGEVYTAEKAEPGKITIIFVII